MDFNLITIWNDLAVNQYHVDPKVFIFLMILSVPFYYWGWYALLRSALDFKKKFLDKGNNLRVTDILAEKSFLWPLATNRLAWVMPYVYVIGWGRNIPWWFWVLFIGWIMISMFLFWNKLKEKLTVVNKL
jgi:hypothetical protein